ncbi:hypothetical protein ACWCQZ_41185 [Streptomyces sp. NPDC002285]
MSNNPQTDRRALRERIAEAIHRDLTAHRVQRDQGLLGIVPRLTDAVLAVLPAVPVPPTTHAGDRAAEVEQLRADLEHETQRRQRWQRKYNAEHARHVEVVRTFVTDRAAVLRGAADRYEEILAKANPEQDPRYWTAVRDITLGLRRMADEAQQ